MLLRCLSLPGSFFGIEFPTEFKAFEFGESPGILALTVSGQFDHRRGGHLLLHHEKLAIEFPPGGTLLIADHKLLSGGVTASLRAGEKASFIMQSRSAATIAP